MRARAVVSREVVTINFIIFTNIGVRCMIYVVGNR